MHGDEHAVTLNFLRRADVAMQREEYEVQPRIQLTQVPTAIKSMYRSRVDVAKSTASLTERTRVRY